MTLKAQMESDLSVFFSATEFAESVTYTVHDTGASSTVSAIVDVTADLGITPQGRGITGTVTIKATDISRPEVYDTITQSSGRVWRVESCVGGDGIVWQLFCTSDNRAVTA